MQHGFCGLVRVRIVTLPDDHGHAAGLTFGHPTVIVLEIPFGKFGRLAKFTRIHDRSFSRRPD